MDLLHIFSLKCYPLSLYNDRIKSTKNLVILTLVCCFTKAYFCIMVELNVKQNQSQEGDFSKADIFNFSSIVYKRCLKFGLMVPNCDRVGLTCCLMNEMVHLSWPSSHFEFNELVRVYNCYVKCTTFFSTFTEQYCMNYV